MCIYLKSVLEIQSYIQMDASEPYAKATSTGASLWAYLCLEILTGLGQYL